FAALVTGGTRAGGAASFLTQSAFSDAAPEAARLGANGASITGSRCAARVRKRPGRQRKAVHAHPPRSIINFIYQFISSSMDVLGVRQGYGPDWGTGCSRFSE